jgi:hypothetical protein
MGHTLHDHALPTYPSLRQGSHDLQIELQPREVSGQLSFEAVLQSSIRLAWTRQGNLTPLQLLNPTVAKVAMWGIARDADTELCSDIGGWGFIPR